jgi:hypothetical protein
LQTPAHRRARLQAAAAETQQASDFPEFESQTLHAANKGQRLHIAFSVLAKATLRSWRARQQGIAFIKADGVNAQTNPFCDSADLHGLTPT